MKAKEDPDWEKKIGEWIAAVMEEEKPVEDYDPADLHPSLKEGILLVR